jgi:hypothetical protein
MSGGDLVLAIRPGKRRSIVLQRIGVGGFIAAAIIETLSCAMTQAFSVEADP